MILQLNLNIQKEFIKNKRDAELVMKGVCIKGDTFLYIFMENLSMEKKANCIED